MKVTACLSCPIICKITTIELHVLLFGCYASHFEADPLSSVLVTDEANTL